MRRGRGPSRRSRKGGKDVVALGSAGSPNSSPFFDSTVGIDVAGVRFPALPLVFGRRHRGSLSLSLLGSKEKQTMGNIWWRIRFLFETPLVGVFWGIMHVSYIHGLVSKAHWYRDPAFTGEKNK